MNARLPNHESEHNLRASQLNNNELQKKNPVEINKTHKFVAKHEMERRARCKQATIVNQDHTRVCQNAMSR